MFRWMMKKVLAKILLARNMLDNLFTKLQHLLHLAPTHVIITIIGCYGRHKNELIRGQIPHGIQLEADWAWEELISHLLSSDLCHSMIRMSPAAFQGSCNMLVREGGLRPTSQVSVQEQVVKILYWLSHNVSHRELSFFFRRSRETTFCHFHNVLQVILELEDKSLNNPMACKFLHKYSIAIDFIHTSM